MSTETATLSAYVPPVEISVTVKGTTHAELSFRLLELAKAFGAKPATAAGAAPAPSNAATEAARVAGTTATTSAATGKGKSAAQIKKEQEAAAAAKKAEEEAAAAAASGGEDDDPLADDGDEAPADITMDDLRTILTEVRDANPTKPTLVADIIKEHGGNGTPKIANVKPEFFRALWDAAKSNLPG